MATQSEWKWSFGCMRPLEQSSGKCPTCGWNNDSLDNEDGQLRCGIVLNNQYLVGRSLGQGGFGVTYLGLDLNLEQPVAIKEYFPVSFNDIEG